MMLTANTFYVVLTCLLLCYCVPQTMADSHESPPSFSPHMCLVVESYLVQCACHSFVGSIQEVYDVVLKLNFTGNITLNKIMTEIQRYERNFTNIISEGVCRNLTDFQTCLDEKMPTSDRVIDHIITSIIDPASIKSVLEGTFCTIKQDLKDEVPDCFNDMFLGSAICTGIYNVTGGLGQLMFTPDPSAELIQTALCPSLGATTECIAIQTMGCGTNIHTAISTMATGFMTTGCKQKSTMTDPSNILYSSVLACSMPVYADIGTQVAETDGIMTQQHIPLLVTNIIQGVCSRLSNMMDCAGHYIPTSSNLLDKFIHNIADMDNVKRNKQAFSDGFCSPAATTGVQTLMTCMMDPINNDTITSCLTPELQTKFDMFGNSSVLLTMNGASIRNTFCSPLKTFVGCLLDQIQNRCNDTNVHAMVGTGRDMLLATLRPDCGGIREGPNDVGDGASGLNVYASVYLLLGLITLLLNF